MAIIPNLVCPRCFSRHLNRFGKDGSGQQKYRCRHCRRQFTLQNLLFIRPQVKYPRCPVCGKASFLHHDYKYYSNFRCGDKRCYHSFRVPKTFDIEKPSSSNIAGKINFKRMRHPLHLVLTALNLYFFQNSTTRKVAEFLWMQHEIKLSHVTISKWVLKFAAAFAAIADRRVAQLDFSSSDEWHCDETYVTIGGQNYYLWFVLDAETRFVLDFHLSPFRDSDAAHAILANCRNKFGRPRSAIVSDQYSAYVEPVALFFGQAQHIRVADFNDWISNNLIESFHGQFKAWYHPKRGFNSFVCANNLVAMYVFFYNFLRPHSALSGLTPAQVAGDQYSDQQRRHWLLFA